MQVTDIDLSLAAHSLALVCSALQQQPAVAAVAHAKVLPQALVLVRSPLVQGAVLEGLQRLFLGLAACGQPEQLISTLMEAGDSEVSCQGAVCR